MKLHESKNTLYESGTIMFSGDLSFFRLYIYKGVILKGGFFGVEGL
jgi:hypothetical protein